VSPARDDAIRPARRAVPWIAVAVSAWSALASLGVFGSPALFALSRDGVAELHRFWTGHAVHFGAAHLRGDLSAFLVWAALVEMQSRRLLVLTLVVGAPLLSLLLLGACPGVSEYRGLSGLDCVLVTELFVLHRAAKRDTPPHLFGHPVPRWLVSSVGWLAAGVFVAKCAFEVVRGRAVLAPDLGPGVELVAAAHWLGVLVGLAMVPAAGGWSAGGLLQPLRMHRSLARGPNRGAAFTPRPGWPTMGGCSAPPRPFGTRCSQPESP